MTTRDRAPAGPRGIVGAAAEDAARRYLAALGWDVLARNLRVGPDELDIVALEPGRRATIVVVEVRSRSGSRYGAAVESVDARKVARLYRAALALRRGEHLGERLPMPGLPSWRVDLVAMRRHGQHAWRVEEHLRGLAPP